MPSAVARYAALLYGALMYVFFLATFLYAVGFVGNFGVPKSIDSGDAGPVGPALLVDVLLLGLFAVQHSVMARQGFKRWWTRFCPEPVERSTFVLATNVLLCLLYWLWRPIPGVVWSVEHPAGAAVLTGLFWLGWGIVLVSTFLIDHFGLFGLRQVVRYARGEVFRHPEFMEVGIYRHVRHPLYLGFLLAFWCTPTMSWGHLLFAGLSTGFMLVAIRLEEGDLVRFHGQDYEEYRARVPMILPRLGRRRP